MKDNLIPRSIKANKVAIKNIEIRLIQADSNKFILRLGNNDYHVSLINNKFSINDLLSDSVTFVEEIRLDL
jgi:hypothetical protein